MDLYLFDGSGLNANILSSSVNRQNGSGNPYEEITWTNLDLSHSKTVYLRVKFYSVSTPREVKLVTYTQGGAPQALEYSTNNQIFGHAAAESCISVGAIDASDGQTLENFSSRGPSRIYSYDTSGNPTSYVDRTTPTICGIDNVQTYIGSSDTWQEGYPTFKGTSAAAPHIAGIVALMLETNPNLTPTQVKNLIESNAIDLGSSGYDNYFGYGRADA